MAQESPPPSGDALSPVRPTRFGRYTIIGKLGQGGMADVLLAMMHGDLGFQKLVVLKRMHPGLARDDHFVRMFLDEARLAARLNHPNVIHTTEVGEVERQYFIAMEYLDGQSLDRVLRRNRQLERAIPVAFLLRALCDALEGLHYAHELRDFDGSALSVVHRDVTPSNLFVTYDGVAKVLDFGIAKAATQDDATRTGMLKGKLAYMSPEQFYPDPIDRRSDLWSMGVVIWELATGRRLFKAGNEVGTYKNIMNAPVPPLREFRGDAPAALDAVIARALARTRDERYPTADAMRRDLEAVLQREFGGMARADVAAEMRSLFGETVEENRRAIQRFVRLGADAAPLGLSSTGALKHGAGHTLAPSVANLDAASLGITPRHRDPTASAPPPREVKLASATGELRSKGPDHGTDPADAAEPTLVTVPTDLLAEYVPDGPVHALAPPEVPSAVEPAFDPVPGSKPSSPSRWHTLDRFVGWTILFGVVGALGFLGWQRRAWIVQAVRPLVQNVPADPTTQGIFRMRVVSTPAGAHVYEGAEDLGITPFELVVHRGELAAHPRRFVVRREGYRDAVVPVDNASADVTRVVVLTPVIPGATPAPLPVPPGDEALVPPSHEPRRVRIRR